MGKKGMCEFKNKLKITRIPLQINMALELMTRCDCPLKKNTLSTHAQINLAKDRVGP